MPNAISNRASVATYWQTHYFKFFFLNQFTGKLKTNLERGSSHEA